MLVLKVQTDVALSAPTVDFVFVTGAWVNSME
jgi:hypothetical protein